MPAAKKPSKPEPLDIDLVWAAIDDVIDALERGIQLRGAKQSPDLGQSWQASGLLEGLRAARAEIERGNGEPDGR